MNILIITPFYKHDRNIASVRWTNIGIRLAKRHNVIVVTQPHDDMDMNTTIEKDEDGVLVARINQKTWYEKTAVKHFGGATGDDWQTTAGSGEVKQPQDNSVRKLKNRLLYNSMKSKAKSYARYVVKNVIPKDTKIDVVISSACPFIEMLFGYELKKRLGCKWISDFRDLPFLDDNCNDTHIQRKIMQDVLPNADAILVVAPGAKPLLAGFVPSIENRIYVITNGFSMNDKRNASPNNDGVLHLAHTGSLYGGRRKADLLFDAISKIKTKGYSNLVFECAGGNNTSLIESAKKYDFKEIMIDHGFLSRDDALKLQLKSDCLVALVEQMALPAKMFEYVLNQKPIICIVMGQEEEESQAKPFIENLNVGTVYEEKNWDNDVERLAEHLINLMKSKKNGKEIEYHPNYKEVMKYDHDNLTIEIENIINSITNEN